MSVQDKLTKAAKAYDLALQQLSVARSRYLDGSGKTYRALLATEARLREKIETHKADAAEAEATFKRLFAAANHERTKEVKTALFAKNDALSMADELRIALQDSAAAHADPRFEASQEAKAYLGAFNAAYNAYAHCEAYRAIVEHGSAIARALALVSHAPIDSSTDRISVEPEEHRMAFVWEHLRAMARGRPEWAHRPSIEAHGVLDIDPFTPQTFVSPVQHQLERKKAAIAAGVGLPQPATEDADA